MSDHISNKKVTDSLIHDGNVKLPGTVRLEIDGDFYRSDNTGMWLEEYLNDLSSRLRELEVTCGRQQREIERLRKTDTVEGLGE